MVTLTIAEIARKYDRSYSTVRHWRDTEPWPSPAGRRGRWLEYDADAIDIAVNAIIQRNAPDPADPGELLDARHAAAEAGIAWATLRSYISRSQWPAPDDTSDGTLRWRRSTVREAMASRRNYRRAGP